MSDLPRFVETCQGGQFYLWEYTDCSLILLGIYGSPLMAKAALALAEANQHPAQITGKREEIISPTPPIPQTQNFLVSNGCPSIVQWLSPCCPYAVRMLSEKGHFYAAKPPPLGWFL